MQRLTVLCVLLSFAIAITSPLMVSSQDVEPSGSQWAAIMDFDSHTLMADPQCPPNGGNEGGGC